MKKENSTFLTFSLGNLKFAINALNVMKIFHLPELTPVEEMPRYVPGVMNLNGKIMPVMDLNLRFERPGERYLLTDQVIALMTGDGEMTGIIANDIHDVLHIPESAMEQPPAFGHDREALSSFVISLAKMGNGILMVLDPEKLALFQGIREEIRTEEELHPEQGEKLIFCPGATSGEMAVFRDRARELMADTDKKTPAETTAVAVALISGEYYGISLDFVQEFAMIHCITPVPCCPSHILGNMNLRGNILTLIDIRGLFDLPLHDEKNDAKAIVVSHGEIIAGLAVDDIIDIIHIRPSQMVPSPAGLREEKEKYINSTAPYGGKVISIIQVSKVLGNGELTVDDEI